MYKNPLTANELSIHEPLEGWIVIPVDKYWLRKLAIKFNDKYFEVKCSNVSILNFNIVPNFTKYVSNHDQNYWNLFNCVIMTLLLFFKKEKKTRILN